MAAVNPHPVHSVYGPMPAFPCDCAALGTNPGESTFQFFWPTGFGQKRALRKGGVTVIILYA